MTTQGSSGCRGASSGSGLPLAAPCQGAFTEGDESKQDEKAAVLALSGCWPRDILVVLLLGEINNKVKDLWPKDK